MSTQCKLSSISLLALLLLSMCFVSLNTAFAQTNQANSKLQEANIAVNQAFNAILDAEKAGANITTLLAQLNDVNTVLAQAENSYRTGDSNVAVTQADSVLPIAQQVNTSAQEAKQAALVSNKNSFWSTIAFTAIAAVMFVLALFLVWRHFKRRYINSLSEAKPEVVSQ